MSTNCRVSGLIPGTYGPYVIVSLGKRMNRELPVIYSLPEVLWIKYFLKCESHEYIQYLSTVANNAVFEDAGSRRVGAFHGTRDRAQP